MAPYVHIFLSQMDNAVLNRHKILLGGKKECIFVQISPDSVRFETLSLELIEVSDTGAI